MIKINFKNLEPSELARNIVSDRLDAVVEKFTGLDASHLHVTLEMHNSPAQAGPDLFEATLIVKLGPARGLRIAKSSHSLYLALAELVESLHEALSRLNNRRRLLVRKNGRAVMRKVDEISMSKEVDESQEVVA